MLYAFGPPVGNIGLLEIYHNISRTNKSLLDSVSFHAFTGFGPMSTQIEFSHQPTLALVSSRVDVMTLESVNTMVQLSEAHPQYIRL